MRDQFAKRVAGHSLVKLRSSIERLFPLDTATGQSFKMLFHEF